MDEKSSIGTALERLDEICAHLEEAATYGPVLGRAAEKRSRCLRDAYAAALEARHKVRRAIEERAGLAALVELGVPEALR